MFPREFQRFQIVSLGFSLLLLVAWVIFVYQVSPLRDPSFQPGAANAGSLLPWLSGVSEDNWFLTAKILAFSLSTNIAFIFAQQVINQKSIWLVRFIATAWVWLTLFLATYWTLFGYLLSQWLAD